MSALAATVTVHMVASVDGYIEAPEGDMAWFETADEYADGVAGEDPEEFLKTIDCYVMGARTYELARKLGWVYGDKPTVVVTHRDLPLERPTVELYAGDLTALVERLVARHRSIWVVGGATLVRAFLQAKLVDEIRLSILPVVLGGGLPFFDRLGTQVPLHLKKVTGYKTGIVELWYEVRGVARSAEP
jgi:dihydrofolate reductase